MFLKKNALISNLPKYKNECASNIAARLTSLRDTIYNFMRSNLYTNIINNATDLDKSLNRGSIQDALNYCKEYNIYNLDPKVEVFLEDFFPDKNYYKNEARLETQVDDFENNRRGVPVTGGGRRSRYRRRPTKKYFKSRRHSSPKKKRHMKTKRHMKRHMKRHIKTKRH